MELEEAIKQCMKFIKSFKEDDTKSVIGFDVKAIETVLEELENSIPKKKIEDKIEELNEGIKRDMKNYDKVKEESWKKAIHHSITQKNESKKILQELLEENNGK